MILPQEENLTYVLIALIFVLGAIILCICSGKSTFGASDLSTSDKPTLTKDSVLIFYAPWCGHCKNSMGEFKKAVSDKNSKGKIVLVDSTDSVNKELLDQFNISGFPTIIKGDGTKYTGQRTSGSIVDFANE